MQSYQSEGYQVIPPFLERGSLILLVPKSHPQKQLGFGAHAQQTRAGSRTRHMSLDLAPFLDRYEPSCLFRLGPFLSLENLDHYHPSYCAQRMSPAGKELAHSALGSKALRLGRAGVNLVASLLVA